MVKSLGNITFKLGDRQLDLELWQKLYYKCQQEYLRKRLLAIKYLYEGKTRTEVSDLLDCHYKTLSTWIDKFLEGGLKVEYIIHLLRLKLLHHLSLDVNIQQVKDKLEKFFQFNQLQTPEQIQNIIRHICTLA